MRTLVLVERLTITIPVTKAFLLSKEGDALDCRGVREIRAADRDEWRFPFSRELTIVAYG